LVVLRPAVIRRANRARTRREALAAFGGNGSGRGSGSSATGWTAALPGSVLGSGAMVTSVQS
jgi:hypothetical protein